MIVIDSSALVDALTGIVGSADLRSRILGEEVHAPALLDFEFVSAIRGLTLGGHVSASRAEDALADFDDLPIHRWSADAGLLLRTFTLRNNLSAYDAAYVVLAEALQCPLITRDLRLSRTAGHDAQIRVY